jgi:methyl-accepting chemotaxis protein
VLIPLQLASLLMILMAGISKQEIGGAISDMNETTAT